MPFTFCKSDWNEEILLSPAWRMFLPLQTHRLQVFILALGADGEAHNIFPTSPPYPNFYAAVQGLGLRDAQLLLKACCMQHSVKEEPSGSIAVCSRKCYHQFCCRSFQNDGDRDQFDTKECGTQWTGQIVAPDFWIFLENCDLLNHWLTWSKFLHMGSMCVPSWFSL